MPDSPTRILVIQAEPGERAACRALFEGAGLHVDEAASGAEGLARYAAQAPDLVVLDRELPDVDGLDLLRRLHDAGGEGCAPVLMASRLGSTSDRIVGLQEGADDYVALPCDGAELLARARSLLRVKHATDRLRAIRADLERLVVSDPLTNLYNRRYLTERLEQEFSRAQRYGLPLAAAMIDVDHFKRVNDEHGHLAGDRVLLAVAGAIGRCVRVSDVVARFGGDEFAVIFPQTTVDGASFVARRIVRLVSETPLPVEGGGELRVTVSVGVSASPEDGSLTAEGLLRSADEGLYAAKHGGKNRFMRSA